MSRSTGNTFGLERGKVGDRIAIVLDGKQFYKGLYRPTNPRTPKQQMHRAKLAFANRLASQLAEVVNIGFVRVPEPGSLQSPRNAFVKANWDNGALVWNDSRSAWELCPERLLLADGPRFINPDMTASLEGNRLRITCPEPQRPCRYAVADDQLRVVLYRPAVPEVLLLDGPLRDRCDGCHLTFPDGWLQGSDPVHIYAWFQATAYHRGNPSHATVSPDEASPSRYLARLLS